MNPYVLTMIKPDRLRPLDKIVVFSAAEGLAGHPRYQERANVGLEAIKQLGFHIEESEHARVPGRTAGNAQERASDINNSFSDSTVKALISMIGGDYVCENILPHIDYTTVRTRPKIVCGYSDITSLLLALYAKTGLVTFYGPAVMTQFAEYPHPHEYTTSNFLKVLTKAEPIGNLAPAHGWTDQSLDWDSEESLRTKKLLTKISSWEWIQSGFATGILIGGCLQVIEHMLPNYSEYIPNTQEKILFLEITEKNLGVPFSPQEIECSLKKIRSAGLLSGIKGLIFGQPPKYSSTWNEMLKELIIKTVNSTDVPILFGVNFGHIDPVLTLPIGVRGILNSNKNIFAISESAVA